MEENNLYHEILIDQKAINFMPRTEAEEIMQNVIAICITVKGLIPLDRDFGVDAAVADIPENIAKAKLSVGIIDAVRKFEPRAEVISVKFREGRSGELLPLVKIGLADSL